MKDFNEFKNIRVLITTLSTNKDSETVYDIIICKTHKTQEEIQEIAKNSQLSFMQQVCTNCKDKCENCEKFYDLRAKLEEKDIKVLDDILGLKIYKINLIG